MSKKAKYSKEDTKGKNRRTAMSDDDEQCGGTNEGCMRHGCEECGGGRGEGMEVDLMTNAARLIREVIGRDLNRRRPFGMYQDQTDDLWKVVDLLEAAGKAGEEPAKRATKGGEA